MGERPDLCKELDGAIFRSYYYLKEELIDFCRQEGLAVSGGKIEITDRIACYLATGERLAAVKKSRKKSTVQAITEETEIEADFVCSEVHRAFFKEKVGPAFSFNVAFQKWLKANTGKTYAQAIAAYYEIIEAKKNNQTVIDRQFEYNTYIRAFFDDNQGKTLQQAIECWKYKKGLPGHNRYEKDDLEILQTEG